MILKKERSNIHTPSRSHITPGAEMGRWKRRNAEVRVVGIKTCASEPREVAPSHTPTTSASPPIRHLHRLCFRLSMSSRYMSSLLLHRCQPDPAEWFNRVPALLVSNLCKRFAHSLPPVAALFTAQYWPPLEMESAVPQSWRSPKRKSSRAANCEPHQPASC